MKFKSITQLSSMNYYASLSRTTSSLKKIIMSDKKIEALKQASQKKKQDALEKTEVAIQALIEKNHKITIRSVAREAGVSVSYIYKYPELSYRIQTLREKQKYNHVKPILPSSKSHQIVATQLRNRIEIVEQEKEELVKEIKVLATNVHGMSRSKNLVERLKAENIKLLAENENLKQQLRYLENQISDQRAFILKQGYKDKSDNSTDIKEVPKVIQVVSDKDNFLPAILPKQSVSQPDVIDNEILELLATAGIKLSKSTIELIKSKPKERVLSSIDRVLKITDSGAKIASKVRLFKSALLAE